MRFLSSPEPISVGLCSQRLRSEEALSCLQSTKRVCSSSSERLRTWTLGCSSSISWSRSTCLISRTFCITLRSWWSHCFRAKSSCAAGKQGVRQASRRAGGRLVSASRSMFSRREGNRAMACRMIISFSITVLYWSSQSLQMRLTLNPAILASEDSSCCSRASSRPPRGPTSTRTRLLESSGMRLPSNSRFTHRSNYTSAVSLLFSLRLPRQNTAFCSSHSSFTGWPSSSISGTFVSFCTYCSMECSQLAFPVSSSSRTRVTPSLEAWRSRVAEQRRAGLCQLAQSRMRYLPLASSSLWLGSRSGQQVTSVLVASGRYRVSLRKQLVPAKDVRVNVLVAVVALGVPFEVLRQPEHDLAVSLHVQPEESRPRHVHLQRGRLCEGLVEDLEDEPAAAEQLVLREEVQVLETVLCEFLLEVGGDRFAAELALNFVLGGTLQTVDEEGLAVWLHHLPALRHCEYLVRDDAPHSHLLRLLFQADEEQSPRQQMGAQTAQSGGLKLEAEAGQPEEFAEEGGGVVALCRPLVAAVELGPGLFEEADSESVVAVGLSEGGGVGCAVKGDVIIDEDWPGESVGVQLDQVEADVVGLGEEGLLQDGLGLPSHSPDHHCEAVEPGVRRLPHHAVVQAHPVGVDYLTRRADLADSAPTLLFGEASVCETLSLAGLGCQERREVGAGVERVNENRRRGDSRANGLAAIEQQPFFEVELEFPALFLQGSVAALATHQIYQSLLGGGPARARWSLSVTERKTTAEKSRQKSTTQMQYSPKRSALGRKRMGQSAKVRFAWVSIPTRISSLQQMPSTANWERIQPQEKRVAPSRRFRRTQLKGKASQCSTRQSQAPSVPTEATSSARMANTTPTTMVLQTPARKAVALLTGRASRMLLKRSEQWQGLSIQMALPSVNLWRNWIENTATPRTVNIRSNLEGPRETVSCVEWLQALKTRRWMRVPSRMVATLIWLGMARQHSRPPSSLQPWRVGKQEVRPHCTMKFKQIRRAGP